MSRTIKMSVKARGETDSPTVEDLLDQVRDYFEILKGVEQAVAPDGTNAIEWRIVAATTNSPITFEAQAFARDFAVNIDSRAEVVLMRTAIGLAELQAKSENPVRPAYFTDRVMARAEKMFERVTNGLEQTNVDYSPDQEIPSLPPMRLTPGLARRATENIRTVLKPESRPYQELGSVEGFVDSVEKDGWGHPIVRLRVRLTGETVKCFVHGNALKAFEGHHISEVWRGRRVQLYGKLKFKAFGVLNQIDADEVKFLRNREELPTIDDITDENFTGGLSTEEYLARVRNGEPS